jgi:hypothetical protein
MGLLDELLMGQTKKRNLMMQGTSPRVGGQLTQMVARPTQVPLSEQFPTVYGALGGLLGMEPDSMEGSILDPNTAAVRRGASYGYPAGLALQALPMAGPAASGAKVVGKFVAPKAGQLAENYMQRMGMMPGIVEQSGRGYKVTPQGQYQVTQPTPAMQTWGGFSSEADYAAHQQAQKNQAERMKSAWTDVQQQDLSKVLPFETGPVSQRDIDYDRLYKAFPGTLVTPSTARTMLEKNMLKASKQEKDLLRKYIDEKGEWIPNKWESPLSLLY